MLVQPITIDYAAGIFDGEGCIHIGKAPGYRRTVMMGVTYKPIVESFKASFGGSVYKYLPKNRSRTIYRWQLDSRKGITDFLTAVRPYLMEKGAQADLMLYLMSHPSSKELLAHVYQDMKHLKYVTYLEETQQFPMTHFGYDPQTKQLIHLDMFEEFY